MIIRHADRIPPTLPYARSQNNNHLLSEAAGLMTASLLLPGHPKASTWISEGWKWFENGIMEQVSDTGEYSQHSYTYHRLMLTLALWIDVNRNGREWNTQVKKKLDKAARWYLTITDDDQYPWPVFGSHDSSRVLYPYIENRNNPEFVEAIKKAFYLDDQESQTPMGLIPIPDEIGRGYLRVGRFNGRPSHADQLHFDLWIGDTNILLDPGTYSYNNLLPWDNRLASTLVHNTIVIDGKDQMTRAGKFLWLDWAQGKIVNIKKSSIGEITSVTASHDGYQKFGITHQREINQNGTGIWRVDDHLILDGSTGKHSFRLQWNFPVGIWTLEKGNLNLTLPLQKIQLYISTVNKFTCSLVMAGETLFGDHVAIPYEGWYSKEYGKKDPCLLLLFEGEFESDIELTTYLSIVNPNSSHK